MYDALQGHKIDLYCVFIYKDVALKRISLTKCGPVAVDDRGHLAIWFIVQAFIAIYIFINYMNVYPFCN